MLSELQLVSDGNCDNSRNEIQLITKLRKIRQNMEKEKKQIDKKQEIIAMIEKFIGLGLASEIPNIIEGFENWYKEKTSSIDTSVDIGNGQIEETIEQEHMEAATLSSRVSQMLQTRQLLHGMAANNKAIILQNRNNIAIRMDEIDGKPYKCEICFKAYKYECNLRSHYKIHTDEAYVCAWCGKRFGRKSNYNEHIRIHTGESPYQCFICQRRFKQHHGWKDHLRNVHNTIAPSTRVKKHTMTL